MALGSHLSHVLHTSPLAGRLACMPGHSFQVMTSLQRWHSFQKAHTIRSKPCIHCTRLYATSTQAADVDSMPGSGVIKAQVHCLTCKVVYHNFAYRPQKPMRAAATGGQQTRQANACEHRSNQTTKQAA